MTPIFLPGWCLGRGPLQAVAEATNGHILDLPGYGTSDLPPNFDLAVSALAAQLPPRTRLVGWSLGAQLALAIASRFPEKIDKLVLIAGTASFLARENWPHGLPASVLDGFKTGIAADFTKTLPRFVGSFNRGDARSKAVTQLLLDCANAAPQPPLATLLAGLDWLRDTDLCAELPTINAPTLLIHGAADPLMPLAAAKAIAATIPNTQLVVMADCAHAPFSSQPDIFLSHLQSFLHA